ncbi:MAG: flagellin [Syntrophomonadaceae bacterium]|nr:flagellin [Syntrophomonadaceae bacterium]
MIINHNLMAMNTHRQLAMNNSAVSKSTEKLSSGYRINRAGDDAAGLSISEKMRGQIRGLNQASRNAQDAISLIQTAEGALTESHAILQRMRELAVQSANDTNVEVDRGALQAEIDQLAAELTRIAENTEFNTQKLLDGNFTSKVFHIGANEGQNITLSIGNMRSESIGVGEKLTASNGTVSGVSGVSDVSVLSNASGQVAVYVESKGAYYAIDDVKASGGKLVVEDDDAVAFLVIDKQASGATVIKGVDISTQSGADAAITTINNAIEKVSAERSKLGAYQNRLEHTIKNLDNVAENLQASESRIRDVDMAKEMMEFTKNNILQQAATAMLAQANQAPQSVLQLLR